MLVPDSGVPLALLLSSLRVTVCGSLTPSLPQQATLRPLQGTASVLHTPYALAYCAPGSLGGQFPGSRTALPLRSVLSPCPTVLGTYGLSLQLLLCYDHVTHQSVERGSNNLQEHGTDGNESAGGLLTRDTPRDSRGAEAVGKDDAKRHFKANT